MSIQDTSRLLQRMGETYPDRVQSDELSRYMRFESVRAVRAVRGLVEAGLIVTTQGSPGVDGMPGSELMLTENGMAVAFGLACAESDPRGAIVALEAQTLRQLHRHRERRCSAPQLPAEAPSRFVRHRTDLDFDEEQAASSTSAPAREFGNVRRRRYIQRK